ncbi:MAG: hypothetical protein IRY94_20675, partial [Rhodospirillaceae bacterium]|nr:hypothetical protein [Rhodospirillaceae bacterium]
LRGATSGTMTQGGGGGSTVVYAAIDLKCGDSTITVSTGNKKGSCGQTTVGGADYTKCSDGKGNYAYANCAEGCTQSGGSGSCTMKAAMDPGGGTTQPQPGKALLGELRAVTSGVMAPPSQGITTVVYATISLKCSDGIYTVSTGNSSGACITTPPGGNRSGSCQDDKGNGAMASCAKGCESSSGAGSCTFKAAQ